MEKEKTTNRQPMDEQALDQVIGRAPPGGRPPLWGPCPKCGKTFSVQADYVAHIAKCNG